jgi:nucleotide-binding universal stress UspA family protein
VIVEEAERIGANLIVIGTRGLTGIKHVALGSVAERVVRHAHCPVLTVKADS